MVEQLVDHATRCKNVQVFLIETPHIRFLMNHPKVRLSGDIIKVKTAASSRDSWERLNCSETQAARLRIYLIIEDSTSKTFEFCQHPPSGNCFLRSEILWNVHRGSLLPPQPRWLNQLEIQGPLTGPAAASLRRFSSYFAFHHSLNQAFSEHSVNVIEFGLPSLELLIWQSKLCDSDKHPEKACYNHGDTFSFSSLCGHSTLCLIAHILHQNIDSVLVWADEKCELVMEWQTLARCSASAQSFQAIARECGHIATDCRSQGRVSQWWVSQVETSLSPDRDNSVYVDNLVTTGASVKSPSNGGVVEPVITNGNSSASVCQGGLVEVDMDRVSTTPAVPSPAPLSSMSATPDSNVEAGTDTGNDNLEYCEVCTIYTITPSNITHGKCNGKFWKHATI